MTVALLAGVSEGLLAVATGTTVLGGAGGFAVHSLLRRRRAAAEPTAHDRLRETVASHDRVALVAPGNPSIDALAATLGVRALCDEWGVRARVCAEAPVNSDDAKAFCNLFDVQPSVVGEDDPLSECTAAVVVAGGGAVPRFAATPVVAVVRHRPTTADDTLVVDRGDDGATSTTVAYLLQSGDVAPEQHVATALLYGIRAGTREFRRVRGSHDYEAAGYLHDYADPGRIEELRSPGMSDETFDVVGSAIRHRERRGNVAVTNVGAVPAASALEEAADTMLRLDGVSSGAAFGVHDDAVLVACRSEDVRTSAVDVLSAAFDGSETVGGNAETATARVPLGLFSRLDDAHRDTLDELVDASMRKTLYGAFEEV